MITVGVKLDDFHRFQLIQFGFLFNFIFTVITVVGQVTDICNIPDIPDFIAEVLQIPEKDIEGNGRAGMSQVGISVNSRSADVKSYKRRI